MSARSLVALCVLTLAPVLAGSEEPPRSANLVCMPRPLICMPVAARGQERFDPLLQNLLVQQRLDSQPRSWQVIYVYVPDLDDRGLEELQIRYLDELLARKQAAEVAAQKRNAQTREKDHETP